MTRAETALLDLLSPVRDLFLSRVLDEISFALTRGFKCETDVLARDTKGELCRHGPLALPFRHDLSTQKSGRLLTYDLDDDLNVSFDPFSMRLEGGGQVDIKPFRWNALLVSAKLAVLTPDWTPLRHWYLEEFQTGFDMDTPDFHGTVHRLSGPVYSNDIWKFQLDMGSAGIGALHGLLSALDKCGVRAAVLHSSDEPLFEFSPDR